MFVIKGFYEVDVIKEFFKDTSKPTLEISRKFLKGSMKWVTG